MSLPYLYFQPATADDWPGWSFNHWANHEDMLRVASTQNNVQLTSFILDPIDPNDISMWLYQHQIMHDQLNTVLGTQGFNLLNLDWEDPDQFAAWLRQNGDEHTRLSGVLGVG